MCTKLASICLAKNSAQNKLSFLFISRSVPISFLLKTVLLTPFCFHGKKPLFAQTGKIDFYRAGFIQMLRHWIFFYFDWFFKVEVFIKKIAESAKKQQKCQNTTKNTRFRKKKRYQLINERSRCCAMGFLTMLGSSK